MKRDFQRKSWILRKLFLENPQLFLNNPALYNTNIFRMQCKTLEIFDVFGKDAIITMRARKPTYFLSASASLIGGVFGRDFYDFPETAKTVFPENGQELRKWNVF